MFGQNRATRPDVGEFKSRHAPLQYSPGHIAERCTRGYLWPVFCCSRSAQLALLQWTSSPSPSPAILESGELYRSRGSSLLKALTYPLRLAFGSTGSIIRCFFLPFPSPVSSGAGRWRNQQWIALFVRVGDVERCQRPLARASLVSNHGRDSGRLGLLRPLQQYSKVRSFLPSAALTCIALPHSMPRSPTEFPS